MIKSSIESHLFSGGKPLGAQVRSPTTKREHSYKAACAIDLYSPAKNLSGCLGASVFASLYLKSCAFRDPPTKSSLVNKENTRGWINDGNGKKPVIVYRTKYQEWLGLAGDTGKKTLDRRKTLEAAASGIETILFRY